MLSKIEVRTEKGTLLELSLRDPSSGYIVSEIEGLDPVKATIVSSNFAGIDGKQYQSSRREDRNIVIKLDLKPQYSNKPVQELRKYLYGFLMPKSNVSLRFHADGIGFVDISGRVESFVSPLFSKEPTATISLLCFNPDFYDPTPRITSGISSPTLVENPIVYEGSVETGFIFRLNITRILTSGFTIYNRLPDNSQGVLQFVGGFNAGDIVEISTVSGDKGAYLIRGASKTSVLYGVSPDSDWINLFPGTNNIYVQVEGTALPYTIEYTDKHGGL